MRKIYYTESPERRRLKQEALLILKQTRGLIDHSLLEQARQQITAALNAPLAVSRSKGKNAADDRYESIDRQKNLATVMKFIEIKSGNKSLMQEMQTILSEIGP
ncbi:MAG: hypothetical protein HYS17_06070 [Micavibrio aeruginosavorus]|uniref:Uncharacterized protein n=1 Tax=Micavibrio aeruginosavorus TaxID=349221 RepID=A0A7T5R0C9_9BACT|nr:MAG: hypothetical protein HYS17_06070 [Micavibrio aeruginosavorus]